MGVRRVVTARRHERQPRLHDEGIVPLPIVVGATANLVVAKLGIEVLSGGIVDVHLKRGGDGAQHLTVIGHARQQAARDALAAAPLGHRHVGDLHLAAGKDAAGIANELALVMRDPPNVTRLREIVGEEAFAPGRVVRGREDLRLKRRHRGNVVHAHGTKLQMTVCERIVAAGHGNRLGLLEAQALGLVLLGVRKTGIDGQHERRVARLDVGADGGEPGSMGTQQALALRVPDVLVREARKARRLKLGPVLLETVARECNVGGIGALRPCGNRLGHLGNRLHLKQALRPGLAHAIEARIDLAPHGIVHHAHQAANAGVPGAPGNRVERGGTKERALEPAGQALGRGDADAHARERTGPASHKHRVHVGHGAAGPRQHLGADAHQLLVGMATAQAVARRQHLYVRGCLAGRELRQGARKHVSRGINRKHEPRLAESVSHQCPFALIQRETV